MQRMKLGLAGIMAVLMAGTWAPGARGAGFASYEGSARGNALGGTLVGRADDASAIYYNPAGITQLPGDQLMFGATATMPMTDVTTLTPQGNVKTSTARNTWLPPHVYATHQFNDQLWMGAGLFSRFGLGTEFPDNWPGRYNSYNAVIQSLTLNPDLAVKLTDQLSLAAGIQATWLDIRLERKTPGMAGQDLNLKLTGNDIAFGYNLGLRYAPSEWLALGASYVSKVREGVTGSADLGVAKTDASSNVELPDEFSVGVAVKPSPKVTVEVGATYTGWSTYDQLDVKFANPQVLGPQAVIPKNWANVWRYQAGVEYAATKALMLRAGYVYDEEPIPQATADYLVPANDRQLFSVGAGYRWSRWMLDVSYTYVLIKDRHITARPNDGVLESDFSNGNAHMVGLSLSTKI
ncbi:MAG: OmpP1/FadL family transporter [Kiritimatiellaeota bacterium]|nr:OmpP1/FadL family transporter [Kiritimatiellota bacterium]